MEETYALGFRPNHFKANREDVLAFPVTSKVISQKYKGIKVPAIIIVGENDPFGTIEQAKRLAKDLEKSKMKIIPDVGHYDSRTSSKYCNGCGKRISEALWKFN